MKSVICKILGGHQPSNLRGVCLILKPLEIPKSCYLSYDLYKWFSTAHRRIIFVVHVPSTHARGNGILKEHNLKSFESRGGILNEFLDGLTRREKEKRKSIIFGWGWKQNGLCPIHNLHLQELVNIIVFRVRSEN